MSLIDYIKGNRKGKDAHRTEREALSDPFLADAIEGYDSIEDNHVQNILRLQKQIQSKSKRSGGMHPAWKAAAAILLLVFGLGGYLFVDEKRSQLVAQETPILLIDIYVPEEFYVENSAIIAEKNAETKSVLKAYIEPFRIDEKVSATITPGEREILSDEKKSVMTIYIPDMVYEQHKADIEKDNFTTELITSTEDSTAVISIYVPEKDFERYQSKSK
ncbi:hypothetical protein [Dysgonomonas sp. 25]|uniref:hypothetical protein n=1 Tax=Dysgonomonas sp. 25 TaxID=2302933 RepID=UPI0013CFB82C|nr:hypothetical protein [Dysgonomonas sp. 25]NDV68157.1 hypothetical protein [Dysgonomonas sp. 25]